MTGRQTFKLTKAETSNTLLLLPPEGTLSTGGLRPSYGDDNEGELEAGMKQGERREGGFEAVAAVGFQYEVCVTRSSSVRYTNMCDHHSIT